MLVYQATELRNIDKTSSNHWQLPGWYRWWAPNDLCQKLLGEFAGLILPGLTRGEGSLQGHCLIYVGVTKQTLYSRVIKWHICEKHKLGNIKHRTLSTFRQTISSLSAGTWADEATTNAIIDKMMVEVFPVDMAAGAVETKHYLESLEDQQISRYLIPLNIRGNSDPRLLDFHRHLSEKRRVGRTQALHELASELSGTT